VQSKTSNLRVVEEGADSPSQIAADFWLTLCSPTTKGTGRDRSGVRCSSGAVATQIPHVGTSLRRVLENIEPRFSYSLQSIRASYAQLLV